MTVRDVLTLCGAIAALLAVPQTAAAAGPAPHAFLHQKNVLRWASGRYAYRSLSRGEQNGEEEWLLTLHPDGSRTLRATNAYIDRTETMRYVILRVDSRFRPLEAYIDYWSDGALQGSGLFTVTGNKLDAVTNTPRGRFTQQLDVPEHFSFIPHPISTDSWPAWYYDRAAGGLQTVTVYNFPGRPVGDGGVIGRLDQQKIRLAGTVKVTTPAGNFDCDDFAFAEGDPHLYIFGPDHLIAKMVWKFADVEYVLTEYRTGN